MTATQTPTASVDIPGYIAGTYAIDPTHTEVGFSVRHLMVSKVRGKFTKFSGEFVLGDNPLDSSVNATIELASVDTANADRDAHLRNADFFDVENNELLTYRSTGVRAAGDDFIVDGELSLHGVTKSVPLKLEVNGFVAKSPFGDTRAGFSASTEISRSDFGIEFNAPLEGGGVVLGDKVQISLEVEAIKQ